VSFVVKKNCPYPRLKTLYLTLRLPQTSFSRSKIVPARPWAQARVILHRYPHRLRNRFPDSNQHSSTKTKNKTIYSTLLYSTLLLYPHCPHSLYIIIPSPYLIQFGVLPNQKICGNPWESVSKKLCTNSRFFPLALGLIAIY